MAGEGLFIGWGQVVRGREQKAIEIFNESVVYWNSLRQDGSVESVDIAMLGPHGGDLFGFALLRGDPASLDEVRRSAEFQRHAARAALVVEGLGVVDAFSSDSLGRQLGIYQRQLAELG